MGDIDGDGVDEIIVAPGAGAGNQAFARVFRRDGSMVASTSPVPGTVFGAAVTAGDIEGDGKAGIALSMVDRRGAQTVIVYAFDGNSLVEKIKISVGGCGKTSCNTGYPAAIAFADIDGDGRLELICVSSGKITAYAFSAGLTSVRVVASGSTPTLQDGLQNVMTVAAGDIDMDGLDEVMVGYDSNSRSMVQADSMVQVFSGDLQRSGQPFAAFIRGMSSPSVSAMDCDGDGHAEILTGLGSRLTNAAVLRIYDFNGTRLKEIRAFDSGYGVNAALGAVGIEDGDGK